MKNELVDQEKLISIIPQSWSVAKDFLDAYIQLDFERLESMTSDSYSIGEESITHNETETIVPYLALEHNELSYLLNNFELNSDSTSESIFMNVVFYIGSSNHNNIDDIVFMNLELNKIGDMWEIDMIEL
ncbi:hypothetical protein SAMN05421734_102115 [Pelagirhabdus alkalitolerans]|uniref:DUF4829 domain-containing protein n=1 Tax=Pelagirhabdus alkalitolerans TaxID=1612202 RepID=A0A1G6H1G9_9BACI|nr:hypothetical protein SAMN05421734_102115 [Pelagirhabdus alkalitolerans]